MADSGETALRVLAEHGNVEVMITDMRMSGMDGVTLIGRALERDASLICILLTAYGTIETAVEAMKTGAYDFMTKPVNLDQLELVLQRALRSRQLEDETDNCADSWTRNSVWKISLGRRHVWRKCLI